MIRKIAELLPVLRPIAGQRGDDPLEQTQKSRKRRTCRRIQTEAIQREARVGLPEKLVPFFADAFRHLRGCVQLRHVKPCVKVRGYGLMQPRAIRTFNREFV